MANDFRLVLQAVIGNAAEIEKQILAMQKKINDSMPKGQDSGQNQSYKKALAEQQSAFEAIESSLASQNALYTVNRNELDQITQITHTYRTELGETEKATYRVSGATKEIETTTQTLAGSIVKTTKSAQEYKNSLVESQPVFTKELESLKQKGRVTNVLTNDMGLLTKVVGKYKNELGETTVSTTSYNAKTGKATTEIKNLGVETKSTSDKTKNWSNEIVNNIAKSIQWAMAMGLVYGSVRKLREGIEYISELNKSLTSIQMVTGMTRQETANLGLEYNVLAREMGVLTQDVSEGSLAWFRQGKTVEETTELMRSSLMMSKLGNMEAAEATEYLTSILNGFNMEAEDSVSVVDRLTALDNEFATSVGKQNSRNAW